MVGDDDGIDHFCLPVLPRRELWLGIFSGTSPQVSDRILIMEIK